MEQSVDIENVGQIFHDEIESDMNEEEKLDFFSLPTNQQSGGQNQLFKGKVNENGKISVLPESFICGIMGKPGSGKSSLISLLLKENRAWKGSFIAALFLAPAEIPGIKFDKAYYHKTLDFNWLESRLKQINQDVINKLAKQNSFMNDKFNINQKLNESLSGPDKPNKVLIVFDDLISQIKQAERIPFLRELFFNRRKLFSHICISIIVTTQKYVLIPPQLRSNLDIIICFNTAPSDLEKIFKEHVYDDTKHHSDLISAHFRQSPFNFVYLNTRTGRIFLNFEKML